VCGWYLWLGWWSVRGNGFVGSSPCEAAVVDSPLRRQMPGNLPHQRHRQALAGGLHGMGFCPSMESDVARCVASKWTDLAQEPKPPHVVMANGEKPYPLPHPGAIRVHFRGFGPVAVLRGVLHDKGMFATPAGRVQTKSAATCWPRDKLMGRMSAGLLPARHSVSLTTATFCCAQTAKKLSWKALCLCELRLRSQHTK